MPADDFAVHRAHLAGLRRQILAEELLEIAFADEAHAGRILLFGHGQIVLTRNLANLRLGQAAHGEQGVRKRGLADHIEEVGLILVFVRRAQQLICAALMAQSGKVAGRQLVRAQRQREFQKDVPLDLAVAQHVRIGRAAALVLFKKIAEHALLIFLREVDGIIRNANAVAHAAHVGVILLGRTHAASVLLLPVVHENADHVVALPLEQERRHR